MQGWRKLFINVWALNNFPITNILFLSVILYCYKPNGSKNRTATLSITSFCTTEYLVRAINWMCGQLINLKALICFSIYYSLMSSNKPNKSKNHTSTFVICFCKNWILSLLWEKLVWPKPEQLDRFRQTCTGVPHVSNILWTGTVYLYINLQFKHCVDDSDIVSSPCSVFNGFSYSTLPMIIMFQMKMLQMVGQK